MSWTAVAALDLRRAMRIRFFVAAVAAFVLGSATLTVGLSVVGEELTAQGAVTHQISMYEWLVPALALMVGYGALVGEREGRTLHHLVAAPHGRGSVLLGKCVSRGLIVVLAVLLAALVTGVALAAVFSVDGALVLQYVALTLVTAVFGVSLVVLAVGISASCKRPVSAATGVMGAFIVLVFLWDLIPAAAHFTVYGAFPGSMLPPDWYFLLQRLNPIEAYVSVLTAVFPFLEHELFHEPAWYLEEWVAGLVLFAWSVGAIAVGYLRFRTADVA